MTWEGPQFTRLKISLILFFSIQIIGIIGFMWLEHLSLLDSIYLTITTVSTVGYGDLVPLTKVGRIFDIGLIIIGVGTAYYTFALIVSMAIEGQLKDLLGRRGMNRKIASLKNHIIVCGSGKVGINAIEQLELEDESFVVIDSNYESYESLVEKKILAVHGDATLDEVLLAAGVLKARGVITALPHDAENVYVALTAKSLNPQIIIVARADRSEAEEKLKRAGADTVIFPSVMGGRQLVTAMIKPDISHLMENVFYNQELHLDIHQITVGPNSSFVGKSLAENPIRERYRALVVAIKRGEQLITTPGAKEVIVAGDILIVIGERDLLSELNSLALGD